MRPPFVRRFSHAARGDSDLRLRVLQESEFVSVGLVDRLKGGSAEEGAGAGSPTTTTTTTTTTQSGVTTTTTVTVTQSGLSVAFDAPSSEEREGIPPQVALSFRKRASEIVSLRI